MSESLSEQLEGRWKKVLKKTDEYRKGPTTAPELGLFAAGQIPAALGDITGYPLQAAAEATFPLLPEAMQKYFADVEKGVASSDIVRDAMAAAKEYPRTADFLGAVGNLGTGMFGAKSVKNLVTRTAANTDTKVDGAYFGKALDKGKEKITGRKHENSGSFYGNPALQIPSTLAQFTAAMKDTALDSVVGTRNAKRNALGIGSHKVKEITSPDVSKSDNTGAANTAILMNSGFEKGGIDSIPKGLKAGDFIEKNYLEVNKDWRNPVERKQVEDAFFGNVEGDDAFRARMIANLEGLGDINPKQRTTGYVKNPNAETIGLELTGRKTIGPLVNKFLFSDKTRKGYVAEWNKLNGTKHTDVTPQMGVEIAQVFSHLSSNEIKKIARKYDSYLQHSKQGTTSKRWRDGPIAKAKEVIEEGEKKVSLLPTMSGILKARVKPNELKTVDEKKLLEIWEDVVTTPIVNKPVPKNIKKYAKLEFTRKRPLLSSIKDDEYNVVSNSNVKDIQEPKGNIWFQQAHGSEDKALGGLPTVTALDVNKGQFRVGAMDVHDIFDIDAGNTKVFTAVPLQEVNFKGNPLSTDVEAVATLKTQRDNISTFKGKKEARVKMLKEQLKQTKGKDERAVIKKKLLRAQRDTAKAKTSLKQNNVDLHATETRMKEVKWKPSHYAKSSTVDADKASRESIEKLTGVKPLKDEPVWAYHKRALKDSKFTATTGDNAQMSFRASKAGLGMFDKENTKEELR